MAPQDSTASQLRGDIDSGRTGDKVDWPDPAAAPLGTDDEAAGRPPNASAVGAARRRENAGPATAATDRDRPGAAWVQIGIVAVLAAAALGWIASRLV